MNRYDRQIRVPQIGIAGQEKIQQASILIVGCGALGTYSAEQLVRAGVKEVILIDPDIVEETNLQRQSLFTTLDATHKNPKVLAAKKQLEQINPNVSIKAYQETFDSALFHDFSTVDLVLDCTDNFLARQLINDYCLQFELPFIFASCASTSGQVMAIYPKVGPCLECVFPQLKALEEKGCETLGVFTPLVPLVSASQVSLALRFIVSPQKMDWHTMTVIESWSLQQTQFKIKQQATCPTCQKKVVPDPSTKIFEACGKVFQVSLPALDLNQIADFCQKQAYPFKKNPLAVQFRLAEQTVTSFKNGQVLFYGYDTKAAVAETIQALPPLASAFTH